MPKVARVESIREHLILYTDANGGAEAITISGTKQGLPILVTFGDGSQEYLYTSHDAVHTYHDAGNKKITLHKPPDGWERFTALKLNTCHIVDYTSGFDVMPNLQTLEMVDNFLIPALTVDAILADLVVSLGLAGRATATITLTGTTTAPSATTDHDALETAGWTVETN